MKCFENLSFCECLKILFFAIFLILLVFIIKKFYNECKNSKTISDKGALYLGIIIVGIPIILFFLDYLNVASCFKWVDIKTSDRWFDYISSYCSSFVGAVIGAVTLVIMTTKQITIQREKDLEDRRVQNMPLLMYNISEKTKKNYNEVFLYNLEGNKIYSLFVNISNCGLNHARNISYSIYEDKKEIYKSILNFSQSIIKKNESVGINFIFNYDYDKNKKNNNKNINIIFCYEDLLGNKYSQKIKLQLEITNISGSQYSGYAFCINRINIEKEKLITNF